MKYLNVRIPTEIHQQIKLFSVLENVTIQDFVVDAIIQKLESKNKSKKENENE